MTHLLEIVAMNPAFRRADSMPGTGWSLSIRTHRIYHPDFIACSALQTRRRYALRESATRDLSTILVTRLPAFDNHGIAGEYMLSGPQAVTTED
jgi:hypothetical protein